MTKRVQNPSVGTLATRKTREKQKASGQVPVQWVLPAKLRDRIVKKAGGTPGKNISSKQIAETLVDIISRKDGISRIPGLEAEVRALRQENQQLRSEIAKLKACGSAHARRRCRNTEQEAAIQARYQQMQQQFNAVQAQQRELEPEQRKAEQERRKNQKIARQAAGLPLVGDWAEPNRSSGSWKRR